MELSIYENVKIYNPQFPYEIMKNKTPYPQSENKPEKIEKSEK